MFTGAPTCVNASMVLQVARGTEGFAAELALVIFLSSVDATVHDETVLARKILAAVLALVLFFLCVN